MIFTAMILMCKLGAPNTFETCIVLTDQNQYRTEEACMGSILDLLNYDLFRYAYMDYRLEEYTCYSWLGTKI